MIGSSLFYYTLIVVIGIVWQCFFLGAFGVVYCASSLASGVFVSVLLPVTEVLAVVCFREKFQAEKGVALLLSLWGFVSYFSVEFKSGKKIIDSPKSPETELPPLPVSGSDVAWRYFTFLLLFIFCYVWLCVFFWCVNMLLFFLCNTKPIIVYASVNVKIFDKWN